ncbi:hypothetical protein CA13_42820 [Planctomycetes bacterium CA13]|uniref:Glycoside hydrolase family 5 domain-containing protein n=1 Tax=Novipirellula herctigrandis TaxID=2527986 RepID=A0A5C5Z5Z2_9BACT|nr:hypothetical protein CA13_42820 [Planctomycetes bacterium CA13]
MESKGSSTQRVDHSSELSSNCANVSWIRIVWARLLVGWIVLICAEVFSGASLKMGLWHPWTLIVTYWLYFAHFFLFTTLAVRTGRTSLASLYLWGVLFGLYESWITKVIWHGYGGDGKLVLGSIGPYGFSELSMVFLFHPVASFLLPLAVTCLVCPSLRGLFPDLVWFTGKTRGVRLFLCYLLFSLPPIIAMNSGGPLNLVRNLVVVIVVLFVLNRLSRPALAGPNCDRIVVFGRRGFVGLCIYLVLLYLVTYFGLRPEGMPSASVQLATGVFYALAIIGLWRHTAREPMPDESVPVDPMEMRRVKTFFVVLMSLSLVLSSFAGWPGLFVPIMLNFALWTPLGFLLTILAWFRDGKASPNDKLDEEPQPRSFLRRATRLAGFGCGGVGLLFATLLGLIYILIGHSVPKTYPTIEHPIAAPPLAANLGGGLEGFDSPYVGHTGSWDGKGGGMFGSSKLSDLDTEVAMGLRWTFMSVYWSSMEPDGPVDLSKGIPPAWQALDSFVIAAHQRQLNVLMQAPVVGGNAGGPPPWAGRREPGKSAPENMDALADFASKLAERYRPGGTLAQREGWDTSYGIRAWELDNEPEAYRTHWKGQAADYAEFVAKASSRIKAADPQALIVAPGVASGDHVVPWLESTLDVEGKNGSPTFKQNGNSYSIGPAVDVVSFHNYEGLDTFFSGHDMTVGRAFQKVRGVFEKWEDRSLGYEYSRKKEYWHTEGNFDFVGALSEERRAAWRFQFFTRAFAAGIRKVVVMDASPLEQIAVKAYVEVLPRPFPMLAASDQIEVVDGSAVAFQCLDGDGVEAGRVWIVWAQADTGDAMIDLPVIGDHVQIVSVGGQREMKPASQGRVRLLLGGDPKMPAPVLVVDRAKEGSGAEIDI